jgi:hypothetical protein
MEIKHTFFSKLLYSIQPKPEGGFIARSKDPNAPPIEGATREEIDQKIQASITADLAAQSPGLKLPLDNANKEVKLSYHVEAKPGGGYIVHHGDPAHEPIEGSTREKVESAIESKLISMFMAKLPPRAVSAAHQQAQLRRRGRSGEPKSDCRRHASGPADSGAWRTNRPPPIHGTRQLAHCPRAQQLLLALLIVAALMYFFLHRH